MAMDPWSNPAAPADVAARTDAATFMAKVYRWMALGLGLTGLLAMAVASSKKVRASSSSG